MATQQVVVQALQICKKKEFGPIAIALPAKWPGMQTSLNQVKLSKDGQHNPDHRPCSRAEYKEAR
jgi:hypothetical protein